MTSLTRLFFQKLQANSSQETQLTGVLLVSIPFQSLSTLSYTFMHYYVTLVLKRTTKALTVLNKANSCHETA